MKIGKYEITEGPNFCWWYVTFVFMYATITTGNWWFICGWFILNAVSIPICLWLHRWNEKKQKLHDEWKKNEKII